MPPGLHRGEGPLLLSATFNPGKWINNPVHWYCRVKNIIYLWPKYNIKRAASISLTPEAINACAGLLISLPPTLGVLFIWYRSWTWRFWITSRLGRDDLEHQATDMSPRSRDYRQVNLQEPVELPA
ncbi:hypothetical protein QBC38DRAFT_447311 [Podospora fimiseda]|uniref:Uncharacterized protein n=1 Tax=Podospora fimiseda TaxID=252190 RepID=A0AAN7GUX2_9PEZI|nr:hypothetical protein QBC38DRAFT_447311 [Podospora fimiseda]